MRPSISDAARPPISDRRDDRVLTAAGPQAERGRTARRVNGAAATRRPYDVGDYTEQGTIYYWDESGSFSAER